MKTYIFDLFNRFERYSNSLDIKTVICNKSWWVFNESGEKEVFIFQEDGSLIISLGGIVTNASWKYIPANNSFLITSMNQSFMLHPAFRDDVILALNLDGTNRYSFMINESQKALFKATTYAELQEYFYEKEVKALKDKQIAKRGFEIENKSVIEIKRQKIEREIDDSEFSRKNILQITNERNDPSTFLGKLEVKEKLMENIDVMSTIYLFASSILINIYFFIFNKELVNENVDVLGFEHVSKSIFLSISYAFILVFFAVGNEAGFGLFRLFKNKTGYESYIMFARGSKERENKYNEYHDINSRAIIIALLLMFVQNSIMIILLFIDKDIIASIKIYKYFLIYPGFFIVFRIIPFFTYDFTNKFREEILCGCKK